MLIVTLVVTWLIVEASILYYFLTQISKEVNRCREIEQVYRRLIDLLPVSKATL